MFTLETGKRPSEYEEIRGLYGCDQVRDQLGLLDGLSAREVNEQFPEVAQHLTGCYSCRDRLVEILCVARALSKEEMPSAVSATPKWKMVAENVGETVRELIGETVVKIREGVAVFTSAPEGLKVFSPAFEATRGEQKSPALGLGRRVSIPLDSGLLAELALHPNGDQKTALEVLITGSNQNKLSVSLRMKKEKHTELVGQQTVRDYKTVFFRDIPPGNYMLEIHERTQKLRFRIAFQIEGEE